VGGGLVGGGALVPGVGLELAGQLLQPQRSEDALGEELLDQGSSASSRR